METANCPIRRHVPRLSPLSGIQEPDLIDLRTVRVIRMRIRVHHVRLVVVVDERHLTAARHDDVLGRRRAVADRDRVGGDGTRRRRRRAARSGRRTRAAARPARHDCARGGCRAREYQESARHRLHPPIRPEKVGRRNKPQM